MLLKGLDSNATGQEVSHVFPKISIALEQVSEASVVTKIWYLGISSWLMIVRHSELKQIFNTLKR